MASAAHLHRTEGLEIRGGNSKEEPHIGAFVSIRKMCIDKAIYRFCACSLFRCRVNVQMIFTDPETGITIRGHGQTQRLTTAWLQCKVVQDMFGRDEYSCHSRSNRRYVVKADSDSNWLCELCSAKGHTPRCDIEIERQPCYGQAAAELGNGISKAECRGNARVGDTGLYVKHSSLPLHSVDGNRESVGSTDTDHDTEVDGGHMRKVRRVAAMSFPGAKTLQST